MADSVNKKEQQKKKQQQKKDKEQRKAERKANSKGQSFEDMIAYVDENGNLTSTPPDPLKKKVVNENDIVLGSRNTGSVESARQRTGRITNFNQSKGYGFIRDANSRESIFVHVNSLSFEPRENDEVSFEVMEGPKGLSAMNVKKI